MVGVDITPEALEWGARNRDANPWLADLLTVRSCSSPAPEGGSVAGAFQSQDPSPCVLVTKDAGLRCLDGYRASRMPLQGPARTLSFVHLKSWTSQGVSASAAPCGPK